MASRKYLSEFGLNMKNSWFALLQQAQLKDIERLPVPFHIYMIARRSRISIDPSTLVFCDSTVEGIFKIHKGPTVEDLPFKVPNHLGADVRVECIFPFTDIKVFSKSTNRLLSSANTKLLMQSFGFNHSALDLEVLYVGQSYGIEGARTAPKRLASHSTLQEIFFDVMRTTPDQEVWIMLWDFEQILLALFDGASNSYQTSNDEDLAHMHKVLNTPISRECYEIDLNSVCIELDVDQYNCRLWSDKV